MIKNVGKILCFAGLLAGLVSSLALAGCSDNTIYENESNVITEMHLQSTEKCIRIYLPNSSTKYFDKLLYYDENTKLVFYKNNNYELNADVNTGFTPYFKEDGVTQYTWDEDVKELK